MHKSQPDREQAYFMLTGLDCGRLYKHRWYRKSFSAVRQ